MKKYILDTHALVWYLTDDRRLGTDARAILEDSKSNLVVPSIVLVEIKYLAYRKRVALTFGEIFTAVNADKRCTIYPLDTWVVLTIPRGFNIHDSIIMSTALVHKTIFDEEVAILTKNMTISRSKLIDTIW